MQVRTKQKYILAFAAVACVAFSFLCLTTQATACVFPVYDLQIEIFNDQSSSQDTEFVYYLDYGDNLPSNVDYGEVFRIKGYDLAGEPVTLTVEDAELSGLTIHPDGYTDYVVINAFHGPPEDLPDPVLDQIGDVGVWLFYVLDPYGKALVAATSEAEDTVILQDLIEFVYYNPSEGKYISVYSMEREEMIPQVDISLNPGNYELTITIIDSLEAISTATVQIVDSDGMLDKFDINLAVDPGNPPSGPFVSTAVTTIAPESLFEGDENWIRVITDNCIGMFGWDDVRAYVMDDAIVNVYSQPSNYEEFFSSHTPDLYYVQLNLPYEMPDSPDEITVNVATFDSTGSSYHEREMVLSKVETNIYRSEPFHHAAIPEDFGAIPGGFLADVPVIFSPISSEGTEAGLPPGYEDLVGRFQKALRRTQTPKVYLDVPNDSGEYNPNPVDESKDFLPGYSITGKQQLTFTRGTSGILNVTPQRLRVGVKLNDSNVHALIKKVRFDILASNFPGYCSNLDNYGAQSDTNSDYVLYDSNGNPAPAGGLMVEVDPQTKRAYAELRCRDFGGWCELLVTFYGEDETKPLEKFVERHIVYPYQGKFIGSRMAWSWGNSQMIGWNAQYGTALNEKEMSELVFGKSVYDGELPDPDGNNVDGGVDLAAHGTGYSGPDNPRNKRGYGDGFSVFEEYRGFVGACNGTDKYVHRRLSAGEKEVLVEIDIMAAKPVPQGITTKVKNIGVSKNALDVPQGTWTQSLNGFWVNPNTEDADNNGQRLLIGGTHNGENPSYIVVYQTTNGDLRECTIADNKMEICSHVPPSLAELTDTFENEGIMAIAGDLLWRTAGVKLYYIIDQQDTSHKEYGELDTRTKKATYARENRQRFKDATQEDYRRFLHLMFVDFMQEDVNSNPYQLRGIAGAGALEADGFRPKPASNASPPASPGSNDHILMVAISPMRNSGNAVKTYLGDNTQGQMIALCATHEIGHSLRLKGHTSTNVITAFEIQSNVADDTLYLVPDDVTHPCVFKTLLPLKWKLWNAGHDTVGEIYTSLPEANYSKRWVTLETSTWPSLDLVETSEFIKAVGSTTWTKIKVYDKGWIMVRSPSPRSAEGFKQSRQRLMSVKYHHGAPKR